VTALGIKCNPVKKYATVIRERHCMYSSAAYVVLTPLLAEEKQYA